MRCIFISAGRFPAVSVLALVAGLTAPAGARAVDTAATGDDAGYDGQDIIVTGADDGYRTVSTTSGTKTDTPILDVPQSIAVVTAEQIADQQIRSVADLVRLTPGLSAGQGEGHRDQVSFRGNNSTADFFVDGLRDDVQYFRSFYNVERVEVHRGPNAMIFGRGGGGGLLNRITKGALTNVTDATVSASANSFGSVDVAVDSNVAIGSVAGVRINAFAENFASHRDAYDGRRYAINPVVGAELGALRIQLGYEYVRDTRVIDRGIPAAAAGTVAAPAGPAPGLRDSFFGVRGVNTTNFEAHVLSARANIDLGAGFTLSAQGLYGAYDKLYRNVYPAGPVRLATAGPLAGRSVVAVEAYADPTTRETAIGQANLQWRGDTGGISHVVLLGAELTAQSTANERINGFFDPVLLTPAVRKTDIAVTTRPVLPTPRFVAGADGDGNRAVRSELDQQSVYIQDQIGVSDAISVIAGVRYDRFSLTATNLFTARRFTRVDNLVSPRFGVVLKPQPSLSFYASYARSYLPQSGDQFINLDLTSAALIPERFDNYEVGAKWDVSDRLTFAASVFRLDRTNTRAPGPTPGTIVLTGAQRSSGVELSLVGQITPRWQTALGYARVRAQISATTAAAPAGRTVGQVPRRQLTLWNRYDVTDRFGVGVGVYHQSSQFATISNVTRLPGYTRVDAAVYWTLSDQIDAQVNIENLLGEAYFPNAHNDNNISTGAPTNARLTVRLRF